MTYSHPTDQSRLRSDARALAAFIARHGSVMVLTGAGISTASGIPAYRDEHGNWAHARPVQYRDFVTSTAVYQRYWARSSLGWHTMARASPNAAHRALVSLEQSGHLSSLITQNVDELHQKAGHEDVINLHGKLSTVSCQKCDYQVLRCDLQTQMERQNPAWIAQHQIDERSPKPDGDVELSQDSCAHFVAPVCPHCTGRLKPDVVFFGETIPAATSAAVTDAQSMARALLVIGSSLVVFSGFRITRHFCQQRLPVALLNKGKTRADELISERFVHDASELLPLVTHHLNPHTVEDHFA